MSGCKKLKVEGWVDDLVEKNDRLNSLEIWAVFLPGPISEGEWEVATTKWSSALIKFNVNLLYL